MTSFHVQMNRATSNGKEMEGEGTAWNLTSNGSIILIIDGVIDTRADAKFLLNHPLEILFRILILALQHHPEEFFPNK